MNPSAIPERSDDSLPADSHVAGGLQQLLAPIQPNLDRVARELVADLRPESDDLVPMVELASRYRGKQLRPALVCLSGRAVAGADAVTDDHIEIAKIVELLHTATLVHDDVLDGASLRRRVATVNAVYGTEIPVLLGDYIYARAFHMSVQLDDPTCSRVLAEVTRRLCQGEITQIVHRFDYGWDEERYYRVITEKTAILYGAACRLGGYYAGGSTEQVDALDRFGTELGVAFQIVDDCLDLSGEENVVGKSLGTDLGKGKLTLPLLFLMRDPKVATQLRALMETDADEAEKLDRLSREFELDAAIDYANAAASDRLESAIEALSVLPESPNRTAMEGLARYVLARRR